MALLTHEIFESFKADIVTFFDKKPSSAVDLLSALILRRFAVCSSRIAYYDFWYDCFGWNDASRLIESKEIITQIRQGLENNNAAAYDQHVVILDSTALLLLTDTANQLCMLLVQIPEQLEQATGRPLQVSVVALHHVDLFDSYSELALKAISSSSISVLGSSQNQRNESEFHCAINHRPRQESDFHKLEKVIVTDEWKVRYEAATTLKLVDHSFSRTEVDPTANIPFNLRLTEDERLARENVQLPHARGGVVIYYEPDDADDIDYEDPDE